MVRRMLIVCAALLAVFGGLFVWKWRRSVEEEARARAMRLPPATVTAITAQEELWRPVLHAVGTLRAVQGTDISSELAGIVREINFESGRQAQAGDLLVQLDVSVERAQLSGLEVAATLAGIDLKRVQELAKTQVVSKSDLDQAQASFEQAKAAVQSQKDLIARKTICAPFSGLLGIRQINLGDYLSPGAPIVTLQALDPFFVDFSLPQEEFGQIDLGQTVSVSVDAYPGTQFEGKISAINSKVTEATRNFDVRATLANPGLKLRPGMFGEVNVQLPRQGSVITLPATAISYNPYGDCVFVIRPGPSPHGKPLLKVRRVFVRTGERRGAQVAILAGIQSGDQVVTSGQMKLQEGSEVVIDNRINPPNQASVVPEDEQ